MRRFIRRCGSVVVGIALATIYGHAVSPMNDQQAWLFIAIIIAVPATVMSFKEPTS